MSNDILKFAEEIRLAAKELETESDNIKDDPILLDEETKRKINKEVQAYSTFLKRFLNVKGNDEVLGKIKPLLDNPRLKKPRNAILLMLEKGKHAESVGDISNVITELRRILSRYSDKIDTYPAVKPLKEILNFGVVNGIPAFKRLLSVERKLYNTFGTSGTLEKEEQKSSKE